MRTPKWLERVGHKALALLLPAVGAAREWAQWPPGVDAEPPLWVYRGEVARSQQHPDAVQYVSARRTRDAYRDFTDYCVGAQVAIVILLGVAIWGWLT